MLIQARRCCAGAVENRSATRRPYPRHNRRRLTPAARPRPAASQSRLTPRGPLHNTRPIGWFSGRKFRLGMKRECDGWTQAGNPDRSRLRDCRAARPFRPADGPGRGGPAWCGRRPVTQTPEKPLEWRHEQPGRTPLFLRIVPLHDRRAISGKARKVRRRSARTAGSREPGDLPCHARALPPDLWGGISHGQSRRLSWHQGRSAPLCRFPSAIAS